MKYTSEKLAEILEKHNKWIRDYQCKDGERADFSGDNLTGANLEGTDLREVDLEGTDLREADLREADLRGANLVDADLQNANLRDANLIGAKLIGANLTYAYLTGADLRFAGLRDAYLTDANLTGANLRYADLACANLIGADLTGADLRSTVLTGANLTGANLTGANLEGADLTDAHIAANVLDDVLPKHCPQNEGFIGWKKVVYRVAPSVVHQLIAKLFIPEDAKRTNSTTRKCRCDRATVLELQELDGTPSEYISASSRWHPKFKYTVGEEVKPIYDFDEDRRKECTSGIHFFMTREEAEAYMF